jgi:HEAT repeat protein
MSDSKHGSDRQMIAEALGRIGDPRSIPILLKALEEDGVSGHAIIALGRIGNMSIIKAIEPFKNHKQAWIRKAAKKAIERIEKRSSRQAVR